MSKESYAAFYPSPPQWAVSSPTWIREHGDFTPLTSAEQRAFQPEMREIVFTREDEKASLKVCRDNLVLLRIHSLHPKTEKERDGTDWGAVWHRYLIYINTLSLLLEAAPPVLFKWSYYHLYEVTKRDAFAVGLASNGGVSGRIPMESAAGYYFLQRGFGAGLDDNGQLDFSLTRRVVVPKEAFARAADQWWEVQGDWTVCHALANVTKAVSEWSTGNYDLALVIAWFIIEPLVRGKWEAYLDVRDTTLSSGQKRINKERRKFLEGRDVTVSVASNALELAGEITTDVFMRIDEIRGLRNKIVHPKSGFRCDRDQAKRAVLLAVEMALEGKSFTLTPGFYSETQHFLS